MRRVQLAPGEVGVIGVSEERNSHGRYRARVYYCDLQGTRKEVSAEARTKGAARKALDAKMTRVVEGLAGPAHTEQPTLREVLWSWLNSRPHRSTDVRGISSQTRAGYAGTIERSIAPRLGSVIVSDLKASQIQAFLDGMVKFGHGYAEAKQCLTILRQGLRYAELCDLINRNPANPCEAPTQPKRPPRGLTNDDLNALRRAARLWQDGGHAAAPPRSEYVGDALEIMLGLGVRIGEALALTWRDVDWESNLIHIRGTLVEERAYSDEAGIRHPSRFYRQPCRKSGPDAKPLIIEAPSFVMEVLNRRRAAKPALNPIDAVFVTRNGTWV